MPHGTRRRQVVLLQVARQRIAYCGRYHHLFSIGRMIDACTDRGVLRLLFIDCMVRSDRVTTRPCLHLTAKLAKKGFVSLCALEIDCI
jgi:hypothetical protein